MGGRTPAVSRPARSFVSWPPPSATRRRRAATILFLVSLSLALAAPTHAADGTWDRAFGKDVVTPVTTGFEICTAAADCKPGDSGGLGGELSNPSGVATDADGNVYVADNSNTRIQKFDSSGSFLRAWGKDVVTGGTTGFEICTAAADCKAGVGGGLGGELSSPSGVATDADGNVYVVEQNNHRIQKFDSSGNFQRAWGMDVVTGGTTGFEICTAAADCKAGVAGGLGGELNFPSGVATDTGGVYVTDDFNHRIQKFDSSGNFERAWGKDVVTGGTTGFEICTVAADCKAGVAGGLGGELNLPSGVTTSAGNVYVADVFNHRIQKFDSSGSFQRAWGMDVVTGGTTGFEICTAAADCKGGTTGGLGGELNSPLGVATDADGNVYVTENNNHRIHKFNSSGDFQRAWGMDVVAGNTNFGFEICTAAADCQGGTAGGLGGELNFPSGVATDAAGNAYVADQSNNRIQKFDASGSFQRAWGKGVVTGGTTGFEICTAAANCKSGDFGGLGGEFDGPFGVATDAAGNAYVVDQNNERIQKFDASGNFQRAWGKDVDTSQAGTGFEICTAPARCQQGTSGGLGGELNGPSGVATDAAGNAYVADQFNERIQKFDASGNFLRAWGKDVDASQAGTGFEICTAAGSCKSGVFGGLGGELNGPRGVATDADGNVYVVDQNNERIQKFDASGNFLRAWGMDVDASNTDFGFEICTAAADCKSGDPGGLGGELNGPSGVATSAGSVYVADQSNQRIQKFDASGNFLRAWGKDVDTSQAGTGFEICTAAASCQQGTTGGLGGELNGPSGVATDADGSVFVAEDNNHRIQKFDASGNFLRAWGKDVDTSQAGTGFEICTAAADCKGGTTGGLGGELSFPSGVATDADRNVYVADYNNNRIQKFVAQQTLTVTKAGSGTGTVTSSPAGINCGSDCTESYAQGSSVTLTAAADSGSTFAGWSGACSGTGTCTLTMDADRSVTATFDPAPSGGGGGDPPVTLGVTTTGSGSGSVTGSGINCGTDCTQTYSDGTTVTLTAAPAAGSVFGSWTGCDSVSAEQCTVTMTADRTVTASFVAQRTLTVTKTGPGSGTITSSPPGVACGSDCSEAYLDGTAVTLTAAPAPGSWFGSWEGCDSVSDDQCTVTMSAEKTVAASFALVHERTVWLKLRRHLVARGKVTVEDGFDACAAGATVKIQRRKEGEWRTVKKVTTRDDGRFRARLRDRSGRYRAEVPESELEGGFDICAQARSSVVRHRHDVE